MKTYFSVLILLFFFLPVQSQNINGTSKVKSYNIQKTVIPPILIIDQETIFFVDESENGRLDAKESSYLLMAIKNIGKGDALNLKAKLKIDNPEGLTINDVIEPKTLEFDIKDIKPNKTLELKIPIKGDLNLKTGVVNLELTIIEPNDFSSDLIKFRFNTLEFQEPNINIIDGLFVSDFGNTNLEKKRPANLNFIVQNTGQGPADNVTINIKLPPNAIGMDPLFYNLGSLDVGQSEEISFGFVTNSKFTENHISIMIITNETYGKYGNQRAFEIGVNSNKKETEHFVKGEIHSDKEFELAYLSADVDRDIPKSTKKHDYRYALVIGNEDYSSKQSSLNSSANVQFARNDARVFKDYLVQSLGFHSTQVTVLYDATRGSINKEINALVELAKLDPKSEIILYYAGHGYPDNNSSPYLVPVDILPSDIKEEGISLNKLYSDLSSSNASRITVFLDACFSGGGRQGNLVEARSVRVVAKNEPVRGNMVVFCSSSGDQVSLPYQEKKHGMFTYFLLKELQKSNGEITYGQLAKSIQVEVPKNTLLIHKMIQTPEVRTSSTSLIKWENWKFQ